MSLTKSSVLTVSGYNSKLSNELKFYKGDAIKLLISLNEFGVDITANTKAIMPINPLKAKLIIDNPTTNDTIESVVIKDNIIEFMLTKVHTSYVGITKVMIILNDDDGCEITIPEFEFEVKERLNVKVEGLEVAEVDEGEVGKCLVGGETAYSLVLNWVTGEIITSSKLNAMVQGINDNKTAIDNIQVIEGPQGPVGPQGPQGPKGETGPQGIQGIKGDTGATGLKGDKGDKGDTGVNGANGFTWRPSVDISGNLSWTQNTGTTAPTTTNIKGPQGATGPQGVKGDKGDQGIQGVKGDTGATGPTGANGKDYTEVLIATNISGGVLTLTKDKYQKTTMANLTEIKLPTTTTFTQIHLFFSASTDLSLILPSVKWQSTPNIKANKYYELIFTYTDAWIGGVVEYD